MRTLIDLAGCGFGRHIPVRAVPASTGTRRHFFSVVLLAAALVAPTARCVAQNLTREQETAITHLLTAQQSLTRVPGLALVMRRQGRIVYSRGRGIDGNGAPFTPDTPAYLGSLSKSFTALAVMQLVAAGGVRLDEPVQTYLPDFILQDPRGRKIAVRHLLQQTSGLTDRNLPDWTWPSPRTFVEATRRVQKVTALASEPGTHHAYHNANYMLLADIVERVSDETFARYLERHVFVPAGMRSARAVSWMDEAADGVPRGHTFLLGNPLAVGGPRSFIGGAGGVISSAADLSRWLELFAHDGSSESGTRLLPTGTIAQMLRPETDAPYQYQYGWIVREQGTRLIRHNGGLPTFTAHGAFAQDDSLSIAVVVNASPANPAWTEIGENIVDGIVAILDGKTPTAQSGRMGLRVEAIFVAFTVLMLAYCAWLATRANRWREQRRSVRDTAPLVRLWLRALLPPGIAVLLILLGLPALVSFVESWSWLWLWYYSPAITGCLWALAAASSVVVFLRARSLL